MSLRHVSPLTMKQGTWLENRYPGAACDVPSHAYTFYFALVCEMTGAPLSDHGSVTNAT